MSPDFADLGKSQRRISSWRENVFNRMQAEAVMVLVFDMGFMALPPTLASSRTHFISQRILITFYLIKRRLEFWEQRVRNESV